MSELEKTVVMNKSENDVIPMGEDETLPINTPTVLVVDDEEMMRDFLEDSLEPEGYNIYLAEDYGPAKEILAAEKIDLIISDINLPSASGTDLLKHVKEFHQNIPIILITGAPDFQAAVQTVKDGAFDYISKPVTVGVLLERVKAALDHAKSDSHLSLTAINSVAQDSPSSKYQIIRSLGSGTMGMVMLVEREGEEYALKIMRADLAGNTSSEHIERFNREAEVLSQLKHPNIIKIYEYGIYDKDNVPYIVMEYISGSPLDSQMKHGNLSIDDKISIIQGVASALGAVHEAGMLHRDVKPANILLTEDLQPKLTDFGIARVSDSDLTMTAQALGTPAYMPPEAFGVEHEMDARSDIFSLGIVCYELFTGRKPFDGISLADIMHSIRETDPVAPRKINPEIPGFMEDIMAKMLVKEPRERFKDISKLLEAIEAKGEVLTSTQRIKFKLLNSMFGKSPWR